MCALNLQKNEAADTDIVFGPLCDVAKLLRGYIPCGKVALIADGESNFPAVQTIRAALKGFECFCVVAGEGDNASGLFSLPDDVRAVFPDVCVHRLILNAKARLQEYTAAQILQNILTSVQKPDIREFTDK